MRPEADASDVDNEPLAEVETPTLIQRQGATNDSDANFWLTTSYLLMKRTPLRLITMRPADSEADASDADNELLAEVEAIDSGYYRLFLTHWPDANLKQIESRLPKEAETLNHSQN